jgi:hypothetical protein
MASFCRPHQSPPPSPSPRYSGERAGERGPTENRPIPTEPATAEQQKVASFPSSDAPARNLRPLNHRPGRVFPATSSPAEVASFPGPAPVPPWREHYGTFGPIPGHSPTDSADLAAGRRQWVRFTRTPSRPKCDPPGLSGLQPAGNRHTRRPTACQRAPRPAPPAPPDGHHIPRGCESRPLLARARSDRLAERVAVEHNHPMARPDGSARDRQFTALRLTRNGT